MRASSCSRAAPECSTEQGLELVADALRFGLQPPVLGHQRVGVVADFRPGVRVLLVEVEAGRLDGLDADLPRELAFDATGKTIGLAAPPSLLDIELFDADRLRTYP
jgi:hypothetical protein